MTSRSQVHATKKDESLARVLIIDDNPAFASDILDLLSARYNVAHAPSGEEGLRLVGELAPDVVLLDINLGRGIDGLEVLDKLVDRAMPLSVIMLTENAEPATIVGAIKNGAFHYIHKPPSPTELYNMINLGWIDVCQKRRTLALEQDVSNLGGEMVVADPEMKSILRDIANVGATETTVMITGESGTGKEMVARQVHENSRSSQGPFIAVNCAAIPENLIETELFGHMRGTFTGADRDRAGKFDLARHGTIFLDELGYASLPLQTKLLRILEDKEFTPLGASVSRPMQARIVVATSRSLEDALDDHTFLPELYYRLNVYRIHVPPLRHRKDDVEALADHFMRRFASECGKPISGISKDALKYLTEHEWPGNIRELRNTIERAVIDCRGETICTEHVIPVTSEPLSRSVPYAEAKERVLTRFKKDYLTRLMRRADGSQTEAASLSGLPRQSLYRMLKEIESDS